MSDPTDKPITVRISVSEFERPLSFEGWASVVERKLKEAGIPVEGPDVVRGTLRRFDDPAEWGTTIYVWTP